MRNLANPEAAAPPIEDDVVVISVRGGVAEPADAIEGAGDGDGGGRAKVGVGGVVVNDLGDRGGVGDPPDRGRVRGRVDTNVGSS